MGKDAADFAVHMRPTRDHHTGETVDLAHAVANTYVALCGPRRGNATGRKPTRWWCWAMGPPGSGAWRRTSFLLVAKSLIGIMPNCISRRLLPHSMAKAPPAARRWLRDHETRLLQGHAERLAQQLGQLAKKYPEKAVALRREAGYFQDNYRRMQYLEMREEGFPIGSGMVESACKQFRARLAGPGMRWSEPLVAHSRRDHEPALR
jgi:hypothetical protein